MPTVSECLTFAFHLARSRYPEENQKWLNASGVLAGRVGVTAMMLQVQRAGEVDLLLRAIEDEFGKACHVSSAPNYQIMLSESWILACYEFMRAIRQREREAADLKQKAGDKSDQDAISLMPEFAEIFSSLELLRMPIAKFEVAKEDKLKEPFVLRRHGTEGSAQTVYDKNDPARFHFMEVGASPNGRLGWFALDHAKQRQFWIERRALSDALLDLVGQIEPAGLREARLNAEAGEGHS